MKTNLFKSMNIIRCVSGASLNLFRYAAMVAMLLMLGIGSAWAGGSSTTYYANLTISKTGETGKGKVYYATSNTKPGSETSGAIKSAGSTTQNANQTYYWWVDVDPGYNVTLSGKITAGPATAATLSGNVACAQSSSSGSGTSYTATANIVAVTVNSVDNTSITLNPTNPSTDYPFTVTFGTSNLKTIAIDLDKSPETTDGKFTITNWSLDGTNVVANGKFNGGDSYGGASRNHSTTVSLQSKASGSAAKTCTVTANFPALAFVGVEATDVYATQGESGKTGSATFTYNYGAEDDFPTDPTLTPVSGTGALAITGYTVTPNFSDGTCEVTVDYTYDTNNGVGDTEATLTLTAANGDARSVTIAGHSEAAATNDVSVTTAGGVTTEYATWAEGLTAANASAGSTLKLLRDIDLTGTYGITATQGITQTMTLDLNGKTLSASTGGSILNPKTSGKTLTIKDSKTGGKIQNIADLNGALYAINVGAGVTLNVESGYIYVENQSQYAYGTSTYTDGTPNISSMQARGIHMAATSKVNISGGKIHAVASCNAFGIREESSSANNTILTITGGEIIGEAPRYAYGIYAGGKVNISNGTVTALLNDKTVNGNTTYTANYWNDNTLHRYGYGIQMFASSNATAANCYFGTLTITGGTINAINVNKTLNSSSAVQAEHTYGIMMYYSMTGAGAGKTAPDGSKVMKASAIGSIENATINVTHAGSTAYGIMAYGTHNSFDNSTTPLQIKNTTINVEAFASAYGVYANVYVNWSSSLANHTGNGGCTAGEFELTNTTINATTTGGAGAYCAWASATSGTVADAKATTGSQSTGNATYCGEYAVAGKITVNSGTYTANAATSSAYGIGSSDRAKTVRSIKGALIGRDAAVDPLGSLGGAAEAYPELNIHGGDFSATTGTTTAVAVKSGGNTLIDGGTFNAYAGGSTAYGLYVTAGKTVANGVTFPASATTVAYGVYVYGGISDWSLFPYYGEVELNNCNVTATARTTTDARAVYVNGTTKVYTQASFDAMKTANNSNYQNYGDYAQVGERAFVGKATINGGTYSATAETTTAYGIYVMSTRVSTNKEAIAYSPLTVKNATITAKTNTGTTAYGVQPGGGGLIENCTITATAGTTTASGVRAIDKTTVIKNSTITAKGTDAVYGLEGYVDVSTAHGNCWHGDFDLTEAGSTKVTAESTGSTKAYTIYLNAKAANVASGTFAGDYATAANATINGGTYIAKTNGGTSGYTLALTGTQTKGTASAQPEVLVEDGKFNGATAEVGTSGVAGHVQLKGGYYVHQTNLAKYIPEGYEEFPLPDDRPEYAEGYRYGIEPVGNHGNYVCQIGNTKYKTLEEALQAANSGNTILMIANYTLPAGDWILKSGVKLLVPYSGQTSTKETNLEVVEGTAAPSQNLKLSFAEGAHLVCNGVIEAGAKQTGQGSSELTGQVYGSYGHIYMAEGSSITIESGATLYAWGYVTGKGEITLKNGGKSYEMFQFGWYKGGNTTSSINSNKSSYKIFPMTDYSYQNIECPITYYPGASAYGRVAVKPSSYNAMQTPSAMLVGTADNSMFKMTTAEASANTWVKKVYDPETDITNWIMNSGASISGISMNVGVNVNSADFYLPITSNFRITLNYGEMNINNDVIFLPGSQLIINKEATGILKSGKLLFFYDAEDWFTGLGHVSVTASGWSKAKTCGYYYYPATYSPTWGTANPRMNVYARDKASIDKNITPLPDAELFVHGKMIVNGSLYTSGDGNASSIGRNANIHSTNEDAGKIQFNTKVTGSKALYKVCFAVGSSEANNSWSDMIYGGQTTAYPAHLANGDGTYVQSSGTEAGKQYVYVDNQWQCWEEIGCYTYDAQNHPYAKPAAYVQLTSDQPDANHLLHDAATGSRNFVWDQNCYWWEVVTTPTAEGYYQSINPDYNGKYNYYYYDGSASCWKIKKITVTWNIEGSTTNYSVGYGTKPEWYGGTPAKTSSSSNYYYIWDGWTASGSETLIANSELPEVTEDITFTAHFYEKYYEYNITFKNDDGTVLDSRNWNKGTTPSYEGTPTKNATVDYTYEFNGSWSPAITTVTGSATYTAQYTATPRAYAIAFLNYDMSELGTAEVNYNGTPTNDTYLAAVAPLTEDPYKPDNSAYSFEFAGWRLQGASSNGFAQVKGDQTYIAQFAETTKKYRIEFVDEDGETVLHYLQLEYGQTPSYTWDNPANKQDVEWNYTFKEWNPSEFAVVEGAQTYTAVYNKTARKYRVTWDANGGACATEYTDFSYNAAISTLPIASKTGHDFNGWFTSTTGGTQITTATKVTADVTYHAHFTASNYAVTLHTNSGTINAGNVTSYTYGVGATLPTNVSRTGYDFVGWFENSGFTGAAVTNISTTAIGAKEYWAKWTPKSYTITFDSNGGSAVASITQGYETSVTPPANPTRTGYTFANWSPEVPSTMPLNGTTCVAQWTANTNTAYSVEHYWQNIVDDNYTKHETDNMTGTTDAATEAVAKNYTGFEAALSFEQGTIAPDGSTVVKIYYNRETYLIKWDVKLNGEQEAYKEETLRYGAMPSYGDDPTKEPSTCCVYSFSGWQQPIVTVTANATYTGSFIVSPRPYTITFVNDNGEELQSSQVGWGSTPTYNGETPEHKDTDDGYTYTFSEWKPAIAVVSGEATYTAKYNRSAEAITVSTQETVTDTTVALTTTVEDHGALTVEEAELQSTTIIVESGGQLDIKDGGSIAADVFIIQATTEDQGEDNAKEEVQVSGELSETGTKNIGAIYYDLTRKHGTENFLARVWYAVAVPWAVETPNYSNGGVFIKRGEEFIPQRLGATFDLLSYDGACRATNGASANCWVYLEDEIVGGADAVMVPGKLYMIYLTEETSTIRFKKKAGEAIHTNSLTVSACGGSGNDANWNGIANPATYRAYMNVAVEGLVQKFVPGTQPRDGGRYLPIDLSDKQSVGQPFFVQVASTTESTIQVTRHNPSASAPRRVQASDDKEVRYAIGIAANGKLADRLYIQTAEEKEDKYVIGKDMSKMGVSSYVAQMWVARYDSKLCLNTMALTRDKANYPLGISVPKAGEYMIFAPTDIASGDDIYLTLDNRVIWNLTMSPYYASLEQGTTTRYGLRLVRNTPAVQTGVDETQSVKAQCMKVIMDDHVYILRGEELYTITGQKAK